MFTMFGFSTCGHCAELKEYLADRGIPFAFIPVEDPEARQALYRRWWRDNTAPGQEMPKSMPQLFADTVWAGAPARADVEDFGTRIGTKTEVMAMPEDWLRIMAGLDVPDMREMRA